LRRAIGRLLHVNDAFRLNAYRTLLQSSNVPVFEDVSTPDARIARMLVAQMLSSLPQSVLEKEASLQEGLKLLWQHPQVIAELLELFELLAESIDHLHASIDSHPDAPIQVLGRYTRIEILAALEPKDRARPQVWREGVKYLADIKTDVMAFTADKSVGAFSPTTRYNDYAVAPDLMHWESQSTVRESSNTGQRYLKQAEAGTHVILFARENTDYKSFWCLGTVNYDKHTEGKECPMAVTWRLDNPLPGDLYAIFAAAAP